MENRLVSKRSNIIVSNIANSIIDFIGNEFGESMETKWFWLKYDRTIKLLGFNDM